MVNDGLITVVSLFAFYARSWNHFFILRVDLILLFVLELVSVFVWHHCPFQCVGRVQRENLRVV